MGVFEFLFLTSNVPFTASILSMTALFLIGSVSGLSEVFDDFFDFEADVDVDADMDIDTDTDIDFDADPGPVIMFLGWLQFGKVPFLILLSAFLASFGLFGLMIQSFLLQSIGTVGTAFIVGPVSFLAALPFTRFFGKLFAKIFPKEETTAIALEDLRGGTATITLGVAKENQPAEAKIKDQYGTYHYVMVVPLEEGKEIPSGTDVTLVERKSENLFGVIQLNQQEEI